MKLKSKEFIKGIIKENPTFVLALGLCPTLAVSTTLTNGIGMGIAATFVTITEFIMKAYSPALNRALGIYVPLIVVNCIVLGRAEAFASKASTMDSILDALGMGLGFTSALLLISGIREILGSGTFFGHTLVRGFEPMFVLALPSGALLLIGLLMGFFNVLKEKKQ